MTKKSLPRPLPALLVQTVKRSANSELAVIRATNARGRMRLFSNLTSRVKRALLVIAILVMLPACLLMGQANGPSCIAEHYKVIALPLRPAHINE